jgi:SAM-dependent methyltransferase
VPLPHDPYSDLDGTPDARPFIAALEERGRAAGQARLRRRFLRFVPVRGGARVLEVGCGTGVVLRDAAVLAGRRGEVVGVDASRAVSAVARRLCRRVAGRAPIRVHVADGAKLPWSDARFDIALAVTVILHVPDAAAVVREMARVVVPGGRVALQDQDFGTVALTHPDRALTDRILHGVAARIYPEPHSGRRLPGLLRAAGLERVRLLTDVYQDTTLERYTHVWLERRATRAVELGVADAPSAQGWLDGFTRLVEDGGFVMTMNYYGAVGVKPRRAR